MRKVVVTGMGIITAIGNDVSENYDALINRRHGVGPITMLETIHSDTLPAAEIRMTNKELAAISGIRDHEIQTRSTLLGMIAAREAFNMGIARYGDHDAERTVLISSTTVGGMDKTEKYFYDYMESDRYSHLVHTHDCSESTGQIADNLGLRHETMTLSTACSSSLNAILIGAKMIRHGLAKRVIAGGTDALTRFTLNGFNTLMILDKEHCRPMDASRTGLNLGEGAAYIVMELADSAQSNGKEILCEIAGYANANDAYHQTASSPDGYGPFLSMKEALDMSGLQPQQISYINAHGTGTDNNDLTEGLAIERIFGNSVPPVSSTKPDTGHTLAAAGVVETVFSILAIRNQVIFPNLNFNKKIEELNFEPVRELKKTEVKHVITNSFGFGGNDSSLVLSKF
ncbi:MAG TPA: beta-ketoacyl-[acyl-carrier-protein] synthase family protein [Bacteroidales bacterium]|nr:beta-ketoacyl-[acyl-carrier-protein] synthase family protein [Bacteroidales bacterium]